MECMTKWNGHAYMELKKYVVQHVWLNWEKEINGRIKLGYDNRK